MGAGTGIPDVEKDAIKSVAVPMPAYPLAVIGKLDAYFEISDRGSSFYVEFLGGVTTFFSAAYIMVRGST